MTRLYLTAREYKALLERQGGVCCVRGCGSSTDLIAEHSTPQVWRSAKPDMCSVCDKTKTLRDIKAIWKAKRLSNESMRQYERRRKFGSKLRGRGFRRDER